MSWWPLLFVALAEPAVGDPSFTPTPYQPWHPGEALPRSAPAQSTDSRQQPVLPSPELPRRPLELGLGAATFPFECAAASSACSGHAVFAHLHWRSFPHFAWVTRAKHTRLPGIDRHYLGLGARVFAFDSGRLDPYLELNLGGAYESNARGLALASEIVFGLNIVAFDHVSLGPFVELDYSERRAGVCRAHSYECGRWSRAPARQVAAGFSVEVAFGPPH